MCDVATSTSSEPEGTIFLADEGGVTRRGRDEDRRLLIGRQFCGLGSEDLVLESVRVRGGRPLVEVVRLGLLSYQEALRVQQVYVDRHRSGPAHALLLCQHPPVYTTGIRHAPYPEDQLDRLRLLGAAVHRTNRGGLITFHGPGQLVCYPVLHLGSFRKSVRWYVSQLELTVISTCSRLGVTASTSPHTGVWVGDNKVCAIGIRCSRYITSHGLALNCDPDLSWFRHIVPCGLEGKGVTSLSSELRRQVGVAEAEPHLLDAFALHFDCMLTEGRGHDRTGV